MKSVHQRAGRLDAAFTLVELMVVVAIVAILAMIAIPALGTNYEDEFRKAGRVLVQDLSMARSLSLANREDYSLVVVDDSSYFVQMVQPGGVLESDASIVAPLRKVTLPGSTKIINVKECADWGPSVGTCTSADAGYPAEMRFVGTGELQTCAGEAPYTAPPCVELKSTTIYLQGYKPNGAVDPRLKKQIVIFQSTGYMKYY